MAPPLIQLSDIALTFGGTPLLVDAALVVAAGERISLVGRNGSGKSTLLKIAAGVVDPDRGTRFIQPGATLRYLPQEPDLMGYASTLDYVEAGLGPSEDRHAARYLLGELGLSGAEDPARLSGGAARRAALARALAPDPDILLLDEPTNHLDLPTIEWLEGALAARRGALVLVSHDRRFLGTLGDKTVWLDRGATRAMDIGFRAFESWRDEALAQEELERHKLDRKIKAEEHWVRYGVTARRKRNMRRMADLATLRQARRDQRRAVGKVEARVVEAERSGTLVVEAKGIAKAFDGRAVVEDFSIRINRRDRIGIVGPNGCGKTTLLKLLTGMLPPAAGEVRHGTNLEIASLDQGREALVPEWTVAEAMTGGRGDTVKIGGEARHVIGYMKDFLFTPEQVRTPLGALSGGERGRLMLARAFAKPSNLLVLDEPTNDLDLETLDVLEEMLADYAGTVILVSHDRDFLDRVVSGVIAPEGRGRWAEYAGGYSDMLAQRGAGVAREAPVAARRAKAAAAVPRASESGRTRLTFRDKHALETLPGKIADLEASIARLHARLDDPTLYARDRGAFDAASRELADAQAALAAAEERWLELEMLREEVEEPFRATRL